MAGFHIRPIELVALKKLELVSQALATKLTGEAGREQKCFADTLRDVITRYEIEAARGS